MASERERAIERIRKLLSMTENRGATENEAVAAALAAQRLMADYDVDEWELAGKGEPIVSVNSPMTRKWQAHLARVVADNFRCKLYISKDKSDVYSRRRSSQAEFFGYKQDAEAARLVYDRMKDICSKLTGKAAGARVEEMSREHGYDCSYMRTALRNDYIMGFISGVREALEKQSQALMIVCPPKVSEAYGQLSLKGRYRGGRPQHAGDARMRNRGKADGRDSVNSSRLESTGAHLLAHA